MVPLSIFDGEGLGVRCYFCPMKGLLTIGLLIVSNVFMTLA